VWTGVSHCPEAHCTSASFLYYSFVDKVINTIKPSTATCGTIRSLFQAGERRGWPPSPPLIIGDSFYSAAEPKARRRPDPFYPQIALRST
jgi:hypothetical protein